MALTPDDVLQQTFKERFKGYDVAEVDAFLERVMASLTELHEERDQLARRLQERAEEPGDAELLTRTLVTAQRAADETLAQAQEQAERILAEARANGCLVSKKVGSEHVLDDAPFDPAVEEYQIIAPIAGG